MGLSIVIVNYKSSSLIIDCLHSIYARIEASFFEVIVVDNNSGDDCEAKLKINFPSVRFLQMKYNAGFARANNAGMSIANGDTILLLNPDTLMVGDSISQCYSRLKESSYIAAGVQLLNEDKTPQISGSFFMKGGLNHLMALPYVGALLRRIAFILKVKKTNIPEVIGLAEVDWINGAFLMVKKEAIDKAGKLDEDFFLYSEEIEWCSRLKKQGKLCVYGDLHMIHLEGSSSNTAFGSEGKGYQRLHDKKGFQIMLSGLVRIRKQFGVAWYLFHFATYLFAILFSFVILFFKTIITLGNSGSEWKGWWGYTKNVFKSALYFFRILSNRPYFYKVL